MGKRIMVAEFRLDKFKDRPEEAQLTKRQEQERFKKYGRLTVLRLHLKKKGQIMKKRNSNKNKSLSPEE